MPFLGEIRMYGGGTAPQGWAFCNGQLLPVVQGNFALFSLIGTTYGGDGANTFALPDLRGRVPVNAGNGHTIGEAGGAQAVTLSIAQMPTHTHPLRASGANADSVIAAGSLLAVSQGNIFLNPDDVVNPMFVPLNTQTVTTVGGSQAHLNMQPFITVNFIIALQGVFPEL